MAGLPLSDLLFAVMGTEAELCLTVRVKAGAIDAFRKAMDAIDADWQYTAIATAEGGNVTITLAKTGERA